MSNVRRILFLAANPKSTTKLRLDEEMREIDDALQSAKNRDQFELKQKWAVRPRDMRKAVLDFAPHIVHFSGHGVGQEGLALEDETGQAKLVDAEALADLFECAEQAECVLLNACYSEVQAEAIAHHVPYVIGMSEAVGDKAALEFAIGFYDAIGAGRSIDRAFKEGCISIRMAGISEHLTPVLRQNKESSSASFSAGQVGLGEAELAESPARKLEAVQPERAEDLSEAPVLSVLTETPIALDEPEGQVPLDSAFYVERPPIESRCYEAIVKPGVLIRIKAPRQVGKSSLMIRIMDHATKQGYRAVSLNFQAAGGQALVSLDHFLRWFCTRISRRLNLADKVEEYWQGALGSNDKCSDYFELHLLEAINRPLALCLDEVDEVFQHPAIAEDFFGLLRAWHEDSKINPAWRNLRVVITHSKEVYIPLNINRSPFNVGVPVELPPLTLNQVLDLAQRHGLLWKESEVEQLMKMVGGHPFLVRVALYHIARGNITLEQLLKVAPTQEWTYGDHLNRHLHNLQAHEDLLVAMKQVIATDKPVRIPTTAAFKLAGMGLVRFQGNDVVPLCNLYRQYFREMLGVS